MFALRFVDLSHVFFTLNRQLCPVLKDLSSLCVQFHEHWLRSSVLRKRTEGPGLPCICALICHGNSGFPYLFSTSFVQIVYLSSLSMRRPSMSNRQALIAGRLRTCSSVL